MRKVRVAALLLIVILLWAGAVSARSAEAAGPWKAQIVDAETGKPLEGVVVLAYWIRYTASPAGWAGGTFYDAEEVVTGPDGRFVIQARATWTLLFWTKISGPEFVIFKPGYGRLRFREAEAWKKFEKGEEAVIEMSPLKTREERLKFYHTLSWSALVPSERTKRLREAEDMERVYLGFRKMHEGKP